MSDASSQRLKVSREGIAIIKSFEGFRPVAVRRDEDGWVIGYGHTLSAREGARVSPADAELLLRYDLLPIESSLNESAPNDINQHQFDALASFAFSVGLERFRTSNVRQRLVDGQPVRAADAMLDWPEAYSPDKALRRRAAERALFSADPAVPVALADLLAAPVQPEPEDATVSVIEGVDAVGGVSDVIGSAEPDPPVEIAAASPDGSVAEDWDAQTAPFPTADVASPDPLVLTPLDPVTEFAVGRPLWTPEQRGGFAPSADTGLFGEDLSLANAAHQNMGTEADVETSGTFTWSDNGAFLVMGIVGLVAFAASMVAFRLAAEQSVNEAQTTMIAWVLAVVGAACVGVSAFNLYRRWGRPTDE